MSVTIRVCTTIAAPPATVWAAVEKVETHGEWMLDAEAITFRSDQHSGIGAEFDCVTRVGPLHTRDHFVVTQWEPGSCMGIEHRGAVTGVGEFRLSPEAGGSSTQFCWEETLRFPWWLGGVAGEQFGRPVLRHLWAGNLRRLKANIEGEQIASSPG
ncbi:MAG: SRPBCC family protein [Acidimicrobiia bacterium]